MSVSAALASWVVLAACGGRVVVDHGGPGSGGTDACPSPCNGCSAWNSAVASIAQNPGCETFANETFPADACAADLSVCLQCAAPCLSALQDCTSSKDANAYLACAQKCTNDPACVSANP
ncbi:MAG TPA: hypothetical protein VHB21_01750 [Minicystis sp.]|nr:hypothetical protein [Minicystis sp.]